MNTIELFIKLLEMREQVREEIEKNDDPREKTVGDKIIVWDGSYFTDKDGNDKLIVDEDIKSIPYFIVIGTNQKTITKSSFLEEEVNQDLLIVDPKTNKEYRTCSYCVKLLDKDNKKVKEEKKEAKKRSSS